MTEHQADQASEQVLTFILDAQEYAVDILRVQEIKGWDKVTPLPNAPPYVRGVINLRGAIVPIVDLRQRLGLPPIPYGPSTVFVVLRVEGGERSRITGVVVDAVSDVCSVPTDSSSPPPDIAGDVDVTFVRGIATVDEKMLIILDIDRLFKTDDLVKAQAA
jgi:purine-binding chemotaxis protein CheW